MRRQRARRHRRQGQDGRRPASRRQARGARCHRHRLGRCLGVGGSVDQFDGSAVGLVGMCGCARGLLSKNRCGGRGRGSGGWMIRDLLNRLTSCCAMAIVAAAARGLCSDLWSGWKRTLLVSSGPAAAPSVVYVCRGSRVSANVERAMEVAHPLALWPPPPIRRPVNWRVCAFRSIIDRPAFHSRIGPARVHPIDRSTDGSSGGERPIVCGVGGRWGVVGPGRPPLFARARANLNRHGPRVSDARQPRRLGMPFGGRLWARVSKNATVGL